MSANVKTKVLTEEQEALLTKHHSEKPFLNKDELWTLGKPLKITKAQVVEFLKSQLNATKHQKAITKFARRPFVAIDVNENWQVDLADMSSSVYGTEHNEGMRYILIIIDVFSRYLWAVSIPNKQGKTIANAFQTLFEEGEIPKQIHADQGSEFYNNDVKELLEEYETKLYSTHTSVAAGIAERVIRTIKDLMSKLLTARRTDQWHKHLSEVVEHYNNKRHSKLRMTPTQARLKENRPVVFKNLYGDHSVGVSEVESEKQLEIGDYVRVQVDKGTFGKSHLGNWSEEVFRIIGKNVSAIPFLYTIEDLMGDKIEQRKYYQELLKIDYDKNPVLNVEKILDTRTRRGVKEVLVKWLGYPDKFNKWVRESEIIE